MKVVRFIDPAGSLRLGEWQGDRIYDDDEVYSPDEVNVRPPSDPSKIVGVGLNYETHAEEAGRPPPDRPSLFLMAPNVLSGHGDSVTLPERERIEHEAELGVIIGEQCSSVPEADAQDVIAGFTCVNDISNRDDQYPGPNRKDLFRGKSFDNALPVGPVLATPDEVPRDASIRLSVNGQLRQSSSREELLFGVPELISSITELVTLEAGDLISTGTPAGVGPLAGGDRVAVDIEGIGTLEHEVRKL